MGFVILMTIYSSITTLLYLEYGGLALIGALGFMPFMSMLYSTWDVKQTAKKKNKFQEEK